MNRLLLCALSLFFISACNKAPQPTIETPEPTRPPRVVMQKAEVKDKTSPPPLLTVPENVDFSGFKKVVAQFADPEAIPAIRPEKNAEYYRAEKGDRSISVVFGDILKEEDAIVNAANSDLTGGGGIDGIIHNAALVGEKDLLREEAIAYKALRNITSFPVGSAMVMNAYGLSKDISMVVATVGPQGATPSDDDKNKLYSAIYNSCLKASEYSAKSISIPAVSTGIFGFPKDVAATLFFKAAAQFFAARPDASLKHIRFTNFDKPTVVVVAKEFLRIFP